MEQERERDLLHSYSVLTLHLPKQLRVQAEDGRRGGGKHDSGGGVRRGHALASREPARWREREVERWGGWTRIEGKGGSDDRMTRRDEGNGPAGCGGQKEGKTEGTR